MKEELKIQSGQEGIASQQNQQLGQEQKGIKEHNIFKVQWIVVSKDEKYIENSDRECSLNLIWDQIFKGLCVLC